MNAFRPRELGFRFEIVDPSYSTDDLMEEATMLIGEAIGRDPLVQCPVWSSMTARRSGSGMRETLFVSLPVDVKDGYEPRYEIAEVF